MIVPNPSDAAHPSAQPCVTIGRPQGERRPPVRQQMPELDPAARLALREGDDDGLSL
jgi:hypothetical protein